MFKHTLTHCIPYICNSYYIRMFFFISVVHSCQGLNLILNIFRRNIHTEVAQFQSRPLVRFALLISLWLATSYNRGLCKSQWKKTPKSSAGNFFKVAATWITAILKRLCCRQCGATCHAILDCQITWQIAQMWMGTWCILTKGCYGEYNFFFFLLVSLIRRIYSPYRPCILLGVCNRKLLIKWSSPYTFLYLFNFFLPCLKYSFGLMWPKYIVTQQRCLA